jgi:hypothetical protein
MGNAWTGAAALAWTLAGASGTVWGQGAATAALSGAVVDASDAVVPGAVLTLAEAATGARWTATADGGGRFRIASLPPAVFELTATRDGFAPLRLRNVVLHVGEDRTLRLRMAVGTVSEEVTVEDAAGYRGSGSVATSVDRDIVDNQPLNGRSFQTLLELSPGVVIVPTNVTTGGTALTSGRGHQSRTSDLTGARSNSATTSTGPNGWSRRIASANAAR